MMRFPPIADADLTDEQRTLVAEIASGPRGGVRGPFIALLHNPALAQRVQALGEYLRFGSTLPLDLIEIGVLVTARHWSCQHEWFAHARIARQAGVPQPLMDAIATGQPLPAPEPDQALVVRFCEQTHRNGEPAADTFAAAETRFGKAGVLDLLALCGYYSLLAMVLNTAAMAMPDGSAPPLAPLPTSPLPSSSPSSSAPTR